MLAEHTAAMTSYTSMKGTCRWMARELLREDEARHTVHSDMWAFGCVIIEVRRPPILSMSLTRADCGRRPAISQQE